MPIYQFGFSASLPETELKALCKARGLRFGGGKAVLVARLVESDPMQMQSQCMLFFLAQHLPTDSM
jgi:hypothetical protein